MAVLCLRTTGIHPETPRDGRAHLADIQLFTLDFAAFDDVFGKRLMDGFLSELGRQRFHVAEQTALLMAGGG